MKMSSIVHLVALLVACPSWTVQLTFSLVFRFPFCIPVHELSCFQQQLKNNCFSVENGLIYKLTFFWKRQKQTKLMTQSQVYNLM